MCVEKPIATNLDDAKKVFAAVMATNKELVLGYIL
jgi:predicted dehydrogenase